MCIRDRISRYDILCAVNQLARLPWPIRRLANGLISLKVGLQGLAAQLIMEAELVAAVLTMKEAVFC